MAGLFNIALESALQGALSYLEPEEMALLEKIHQDGMDWLDMEAEAEAQGTNAALVKMRYEKALSKIQRVAEQLMQDVSGWNIRDTLDKAFHKKPLIEAVKGR